MFHILVVAVALTACVAEEEIQATASPGPIVIHNDHQHRVEQHRVRENLARLRGHLHDIYHQRDERHRDERHHDDRHRNDHHHDERHRVDHLLREAVEGRWREHHNENYNREPEGPVILRTIRPNEHEHRTMDISRQNKIISDVYSPDYAQPTWILDYRYQKTGGQEFTRGPGGQIIVLPKGVHNKEYRELKNYDELLEQLRLRNIAERGRVKYFAPPGKAVREKEPENQNLAPPQGFKYEEEDQFKYLYG